MDSFTPAFTSVKTREQAIYACTCVTKQHKNANKLPMLITQKRLIGVGTKDTNYLQSSGGCAAVIYTIVKLETTDKKALIIYSSN